MSIAHQILPSDKNEVEFFAEISEDGRFEVQLPLTDANRRERQLTLVHFQTVNPFIPSSLQTVYDGSDVDGNVYKQIPFYVLDVDVEKLWQSSLIDSSESLLKNNNWKDFSKLEDVWDASSKQTGLILNSKYLRELMTKFWEDVSLDRSDDYKQDLDLTEYVQVFVEIGNKVTEGDMQKEGFDVKTMRPDKMKMYLFPLNFFMPLITEQDKGNGSIDLDVGSFPSFNYDESLRSMVRYALIDMNKGDIRSSFNESKRCAYLEYQVSEGGSSDKSVTKYVFAWTLGNPIFYDCKWMGEDQEYIYRYNFIEESTEKKGTAYNRRGTYVHFSKMYPGSTVGRIDNTYLKDFFCDLGYTLSAASKADSNMDNCLMNVFRCGWSFVFAGALYYYFKSSQYPLIGKTLKETMKYINVFDGAMVKEKSILEMFCGSMDFGGQSYIANIRSISMFVRPSNMSFYGSDLVLRLLCEQVQTIVSGGSKRKSRMSQVLATLTSNEQTYQTFNGNDNKIVYQPPTFRPLLYLQEEKSIIVGNSSRTLNFYLLNSEDKPVKFQPGDTAYIKFRIEAV